MGPLSITPNSLVREVPESWSFSVQCPCNRSAATLVPVSRLIAEGRGGLTILEVGDRLRCKACGRRGPSVSLTERTKRRPWEPERPSGTTIGIKS